ncbi:MAG: YoaK family protein [Weeksellaceae bacterium]
MFRHHGKKRTRRHNLQIAIVLSFIAGIVNATGFLAFHELTTNVTGHFALFIDDLAHFNFWKGAKYFLFILSFLIGSFTSGFLIEMFRENKKLNVYLIPTIIECLILFIMGISSNFIEITYQNLMTCSLLFVMGLQNAFVTKISDAVVRTTHLTGLFTDLGIELSYLLFPKSHKNRDKLITNIKLRLYIITFFFIGGMVGGFIFSELQWGLNTLNVAGLILLLSLFYDDMRLQTIKTTRRLKERRRKRHYERRKLRV